MQPSWLPSVRWQCIYLLASRILFGLLAGLIGGPFIGLGLEVSREGLLRGIVEGVTGGLAGGIAVALHDLFSSQLLATATTRDGFRGRLISLAARLFDSSRRRTVWHVVLVALSSAIISNLLFMAGLRLIDWCRWIDDFCAPPNGSWTILDWLSESIQVGLVVGLSFGLVFGIEPRQGRRNFANDIQASGVEQIGWSMPRALLWGTVGGVFGALVGLCIGILDQYTQIDPGSPVTDWAYRQGLEGLRAVLALTVLTAAICAAASAVAAGLTGSAIHPTNRRSPYQGITTTLTNASVYGLLVGLFFAVIGQLLDPTGAFRFYGVFIGYLAFMWFGGLSLFLHVVLRFLLARLGYAPPLFLYVPFLNYCTGLGFMQRIYGGYDFRHNYWRRHFASMACIPSSALQSDDSQGMPAAPV
jgi:hypothetical protein